MNRSSNPSWVRWPLVCYPDLLVQDSPLTGDSTAQWESIRLQIERPPVQIRLPPVGREKILLFLRSVFKGMEPAKNVVSYGYLQDMQNQRFLQSFF